jgi:hypothetical protein
MFAKACSMPQTTRIVTHAGGQCADSSPDSLRTPTRIPLCISDAAIASLPELRLCDASAPDLLYLTHCSQLSGERPVHTLLGIEQPLLDGSEHLVGFDVEWRPKFGKEPAYESGDRSARAATSLPASVVQLCSERHVIVVNLLSLGLSLVGNVTARHACAAGFSKIVSVFEDVASTLSSAGVTGDDISCLACFFSSLEVKRL